jgi:hypothetical protein
MKKSYFLIFIVLIVIMISLLSYSIVRDIKVQNQIYELNQLFLENPMEQENIDLEKYESYIQNYILNQKNLKEMWWNTIINQSGLSIIFTAIVLFLTVSLSWITQHNIQEQYKKDLDKTTKYTEEIISDVMLFSKYHTERPAFFKSYGDDIEISINRLNSYNLLKILNREKLEESYFQDLDYCAKNMWQLFQEPVQKIFMESKSKKENEKLKIQNFMEPIKFGSIKQKIEDSFNRITNNIDRVNIIDFLEKYQNEQPWNPQENRKILNCEVFDYLKNITHIDRMRINRNT